MPSLNLPGKRFFFRRTDPIIQQGDVKDAQRVRIVQPFPKEQKQVPSQQSSQEEHLHSVDTTAVLDQSSESAPPLMNEPVFPLAKESTSENRDNRFTWMVGGEAGYGIMVTGLLFSKACTRGGLHIFDYAEYPSLIRGGHNSYHVRVEDKPIYSQVHWVDLLVALDQLTIQQHYQEISPNGGLLYESSKVKLDPPLDRTDLQLYPIPLIELAKEAGGDDLMKNTVALGASFALVDYDLAILDKLIEEIFARKGQAVAINKKAIQLGHDYVTKHFNEPFGWKLTPLQKNALMVISGNEALVAGALRAGCKFLAAYPMTPINAILHTMAAKDQEFKIIVKEPEDEIAGINMAIGASHAGVRAITATSGGGFSLMVEGVGLAAETETPLVIVEGMRPGPATGMPTWTEQGDLRFVMHCHQGDFPRIVMAPGDPQDNFTLIAKAFNLAEKYQLVVIFLTDKYLAEAHWSVSPFDQSTIVIDRGKWLSEQDLASRGKRYERFEFTQDGVTPRVVPGTKGGESMVTSDEHDARGLFEESAKNRKAIVEKRFKKLAAAIHEFSEPALVGPEDADLTILAWGSTKGPILEAMKLCEEQDLRVNYQQIVYLLPFPTDLVTALFSKAEKTLVIENNFSGQFDGLVTQMTQKKANYVLLKHDGRPFYPQEIFEHIQSIRGGKAESRTAILTKWHDHEDISGSAQGVVQSSTATARAAMSASNADVALPPKEISDGTD